jgi:hypothetical protein
MEVSKFDDVPAGPTVSNKPSRLNANNILVSSCAILVEYLIVLEFTSMGQKRSPYAHKWERNRHIGICFEVYRAVRSCERGPGSWDMIRASFDPHAFCCNPG